MPMLRAERITLERNGAPVLSDLGAEFPASRITFVRGPSGAGKTTLLRVLAGLEPSARGEIAFDDNVWQSGRRRLPPWRRDIGFVAQDLSLWPHLSVAGHLSLAFARRKNWDRDRRRQRTRELLAALEIDHLINRRPSQLSGGEQQRLAIARAVASVPRVLLLDEPTAHLDSRLKDRVTEIILSLTSSHDVVTIWVEHDHSNTSNSDVIVYRMERGRLKR